MLELEVVTAMSCILWVPVNWISPISHLSSTVLRLSRRETGDISSALHEPFLLMRTVLSRYVGATEVLVKVVAVFGAFLPLLATVTSVRSVVQVVEVVCGVEVDGRASAPAKVVRG